MLSLVSLAHNHRLYTKMLLTSLANPLCADTDFEFVFIDNGSSDDTATLVREFPLHRNPHFKKLKFYEFPHNRGVAAAINEGVRLSAGAIILQADNDVVFGPHSLSGMLRWSGGYPTAMISPNWPWLQKKLGARYFGAAGEINESNLKRLQRLGMRAPVEFFRATGSCWMCPRTLFDQVGGWDESFLNICASDDFIWKISMTGVPRLVVPSSIYHAGEITRKQLPRSSEQERKDMARFQERWGGQPEDKESLRRKQRAAGLEPDPGAFKKFWLGLTLKRRG